jgi:hypothetical protein
MTVNKTTLKTLMKTQIKDGVLFLEIPIQSLAPSASGKTLVVASTHGNMTTGTLVEGKPLVIGLNAYIKK